MQPLRGQAIADNDIGVDYAAIFGRDRKLSGSFGEKQRPGTSCVVTNWGSRTRCNPPAAMQRVSALCSDITFGCFYSLTSAFSGYRFTIFMIRSFSVSPFSIGINLPGC